MTPEEFHKHIHRIIPSGMDLTLNGIVFDLGSYLEPEETRRFVTINGDTIWSIVNGDRIYKFLYTDNTVILKHIDWANVTYSIDYSVVELQNMPTFEIQYRYNGELGIFIRYIYKRYIDIVNDPNFVF